MFKNMRRFKQQITDEQYLALIPEHMTGKLVNES